MTLTFSKITLIIIAWSLLLPIYLGNVNVRTSVIAQNSEDDEPPIDDEVENGDDDDTTTDDDDTTTDDDDTTTDDDDTTTDDDDTTTDDDDTTTNDTTTDDTVLNGKGATLDSLGEYQDALEYYDRALAIDPNNVDIVNNKGGALGNLGRYEEAMEYIDGALAIDPNNVDIVNNKGAALFYLGRDEEALEYYDRALAIDPNNTNALTNKGTTLAGLGRYEEAIGYFDRVLNIDPNYGPALVNKGAALGNLGRHQEAIEYFETTSLIQESSITTAPDSSNKKNYFVLITNVWEKEYSSRNRLAQYYSNVDLGKLQLDNLRRDREETYALHFISHGYEIDINKQVNIGIAKFKNGDYQVAIDIFNEIWRLHQMHPSELVQNLTLAASLYNGGLCLEKLGNLTGDDHYKKEASKINDQLVEVNASLDPDYNADYVRNNGPYVLKAHFSSTISDLIKAIPFP
jgi:tetratricopeptide (TPR) repeat protein